MGEDKKKDKWQEGNSKPSSPVCYSGMDGLRAGFNNDDSEEESKQFPDDYSQPDNPEKIPLIFAQAWMKRDAKHLASLFESDAEFVNVVGLWWHNRPDIEKAHDYGLKKIFNESTLIVEEVKTKILSDTIAVVHAKMKLAGQTLPENMDGNTGTRHTIFTFVVRRKKDNWKCVSAQNTEVILKAETFVNRTEGGIHPVTYRH